MTKVVQDRGVAAPNNPREWMTFYFCILDILSMCSMPTFYLKYFYHIIYGHPDKYALKDNPLNIHSNLMHSCVIFFILSFHISGAMQPYARGDPH